MVIFSTVCPYLPGMSRQNVLKLILKSLRFVPFGGNLTHFGGEPDSRGKADKTGD